jgi:hypothetical protein
MPMPVEGLKSVPTHTAELELLPHIYDVAIIIIIK